MGFVSGVIVAIVKGPALSLAASGNLGPVCFSRWRTLAIARDVWTGTVPNTGKQVIQQGHLTQVAQAWGGTLTAAQRQTWHDRAETVLWRDRMGDQYIPTGYQLFMKWNVRRRVMGLTIMTDAPMLQEWVFVFKLTVTPDPGVPCTRMWLRPGDAGLVDSYGIEYWKAGPYDSGGRAPIAGEWLFLSRKVPPAYYRDNDVIVDKWYWYRARAVAEFGDVQNWFYKQVQIA